MASFLFELCDAVFWGVFTRTLYASFGFVVAGWLVGKRAAKRGHRESAPELVVLGWIVVLVFATRMCVTIRNLCRGGRSYFQDEDLTRLDLGEAERVLQTLSAHPQSHAPSASSLVASVVPVITKLYGFADAHFERSLGHATTSILHDIIVHKLPPPPKSGMRILEQFVTQSKDKLRQEQERVQATTHSIDTVRALLEDEDE
jgi:hypothetical protein